MKPIVMTLVFSVVMLMFMAFPAMKIVEWIDNYKELSPRFQNILTIVITILLSLVVGIFLEMA
jgi:uncharacterized protein involved in cysteine biosynthesis